LTFWRRHGGSGKSGAGDSRGVQRRFDIGDPL
jgi:hypothetical protein